ncbi:hypothetical protein PR048_004794 [Dryococelus australis]|uniref:Uncharacterized protein n=1 Tax=Dryococelus australis TaxID=614101 RepID=A0ABQ9I6F4_9NEOP|nr:hypothetical protein PR048_004794 [Dryococelus australis]
MHQATTELCGDKTPTISMVNLLLFLLKFSLARYIANHSKLPASDVEFAKLLLFSIKARVAVYDHKEPYFSGMLWIQSLHQARNFIHVRYVQNIPDQDRLHLYIAYHSSVPVVRHVELAHYLCSLQRTHWILGTTTHFTTNMANCNKEYRQRSWWNPKETEACKFELLHLTASSLNESYGHNNPSGVSGVLGEADSTYYTRHNGNLITWNLQHHVEAGSTDGGALEDKPH